MTYRVRIEEIKGDKLVKLFDKNIDKGIMKIGDTVGMIGFNDPMEIMLELEDFIQHLALKMTGLNEGDEPDEELVLAAAITECVIGINLAAMAIGPVSEYGLIKDEEKNLKLKRHALELLAKGKEISKLSGIIEVSSMEDHKKKLGELLMEELEKAEENDD